MAEEHKDQEGITKVRRACEEYGIRTCKSVSDFNSILRSLGEDAAEAQIYEDEEFIQC